MAERENLARPGAAAMGRATTTSTELGSSRQVYREPINYRTDPEQLTSAAIVAELLQHIADAESWSGVLGEHARKRTTALQAEFVRRWRLGADR